MKEHAPNPKLSSLIRRKNVHGVIVWILSWFCFCYLGERALTNLEPEGSSWIHKWVMYSLSFYSAWFAANVFTSFIAVDITLEELYDLFKTTNARLEGIEKQLNFSSHLKDFK